MADVVLSLIVLSPTIVKVAGSPSPATNWKLTSLGPPIADLNFGGRGRIQGTVKEKGSPLNLPLHRRVRLMRERDGLIVRETWSDAATGAYEFTNIDPTLRYTALSYDYTNAYRAVVADNLTPEII